MKEIRILILCLIALLMTMSTVHAQVSFIVSSPKAGDTWKIGETKNIEWSYSSPQAVSQNWKLELMKGSTVVGTIANNVSGSSKSWVVGQYAGGNATPGADYKIRVSHVTQTQINQNSGVFSIIFSPIAQKVKAPTQPPILQKTDPKQKVRELQAAEDRKRTNRQLALKSEVNKLVQKDLEITKAKKKVEICTSPKIFFVSSQEVYPGDPVYIRGCGFGISKGMVSISPLNKQLEIETWVDGGIVGKIPLNITGFADPKAITLKVFTIQGNASAPSENLTLKPNPEIKTLSITNPVLSTACGESPQYIGTLYQVIHSNQGNQTCQGIDTVFQTLQLKNNWVFNHFSFDVGCTKVEILSSVIHYTKTDCNFFGSRANPVQNLNLLVGKSTIPNIQIDWCVGPPHRPKYFESILMYGLDIFIAGPAGTNYQ